MTALKTHIGSTVLISGYTIQADLAERKVLKVYKDAKSAKFSFAYNDAANLKEISLIHGVLTKASSIPSEIDPCLDIFVLIPNATQTRDDVIIKCIDLEYLQQLVMYVTSEYGAIYNEDLSEDFDKDEDLLELETHDIENIYVLYGYEIELFFTFEEDSIDESLIDESEKLYKNIKDEQY